MNWTAMADALDITTEMRPVYRAGKRGFLTKEAAIRDAAKGIARRIDYCDCAPSEPDTMDGRGYPGHYCGCRARIEEMVEVLTEVAKRLPESVEEWRQKTSGEFWESYQFAKEDA